MQHGACFGNAATKNHAMSHEQDILRRAETAEARTDNEGPETFAANIQPPESPVNTGGGLQLVLVTMDHASPQAGDADNDCNFTYEVRELDDTTVIAEDQTPETPRYAKTAYYYAGENSSSRYALWHSAEAKLLICFGEIAQTSVCP